MGASEGNGGSRGQWGQQKIMGTAEENGGSTCRM